MSGGLLPLLQSSRVGLEQIVERHQVDGLGKPVAKSAGVADVTHRCEYRADQIVQTVASGEGGLKGRRDDPVQLLRIHDGIEGRGGPPVERCLDRQAFERSLQAAI